MPEDLRCPGKRQAILVTPAAGGVVEVKCDSRICGARPGRVVLHRFDTSEGLLLETIKFSEHPATSKKGSE